jgi:hypothetical protein
MPSESKPPFDLVSRGRAGPPERFTPQQIAHISRTVRRTPEVMVKVSGGARKLSAALAHMAYISHHGEVELESDDGRTIPKEDQKALLTEWHLELSSGQYRRPTRDGRPPQPIKLIHNIVLSMPSPTPPEKVRAAAKQFAREKFGGMHRYAMALHTHQEHPHVHLLVKAEREDGLKRLHIDKAMLREWREDFARAMREQGVPAHATSRAARGRNKGPLRDATLRAARGGRSSFMREKVLSVAEEIARLGAVRDPANARLRKTRGTLIDDWLNIASKLEAQGETFLASEVRSFADALPPVRTDREQLAAKFTDHLKSERLGPKEPPVRDRILERTR